MFSTLARKFHTDPATACEGLMDRASGSDCSSGGMEHTAVVATHRLPCLHQDSRRLATNQYEICGLDLLFSTTPLDGPGQMALDEVVLGLVERPLLRVYRWASPCVTFGYFQKYELVKKLYPDQMLVRRWSGGGCVEHGEDFTFSLMVPESEPVAGQAPSLFYRQLHEAIVVGLQRHGIQARLAAQEDQAVGESCFIAPCPCDVMLDRKKIVGGAQRRSQGRMLYQGSLNLGDRSWKIEDGKSKQFFISLAEQLAPDVALIEEKERWLEAAHQLSCQRYRLAEWTEKR